MNDSQNLEWLNKGIEVYRKIERRREKRLAIKEMTEIAQRDAELKQLCELLPTDEDCYDWNLLVTLSRCADLLDESKYPSLDKQDLGDTYTAMLRAYIPEFERRKTNE